MANKRTQTAQETLPMETTEQASPPQYAVLAGRTEGQKVYGDPPTLVGGMPTPGPQLPVLHSAESLIAKAIDANVPIETMERLLAMRDRLKAEQAKEQFFAALSAAQAEFPVIPKTKSADRYKYAPMDVIITHVQPILAKHGLSHTIKSAFTETHVEATCHVHHVGGHTESSSFKAPIDKSARINDIQKTAAARTYAMRYAFSDAHGIVTGDEDNDAQTVAPSKQETYALKPDATATVERIKALAEAKNVPGETILSHYSVETLDDLTAAQRTEAVQKLLAMGQRPRP